MHYGTPTQYGCLYRPAERPGPGWITPVPCRHPATSPSANGKLVLVLLLAVWLSCSPTLCADEHAPEFQVKAAFLYHFANFVSWPTPIGDRFRLCVVGSNPFGEHIDPLIGRSVHDSILVIDQHDSTDDLHDCHLAYISPSLQSNLTQVLAKLAGQPILTVSDITAFTDAGGMIGLGLMIATGCLSWRDAGSALSIPVVMIIVTALALGKALMGTGMADYIAFSFVGAASALPTPMILSAFLLLMTVMTNIVSNNAAAAIGTPIAVSIAAQLGVPPEPFILAVLFGANMSFATPYGYQTNLLILSAGGYKFSDFLRVGIPLTVIMWIGFSLVLPVLYDL